MCIIVSIPAGVATPSEEILKRCWDANTHGAGFMWQQGPDRTVMFSKGCMTWDSFKTTLAQYDATMPKDAAGNPTVPRVIHFRIGTHGKNSPKLTHPFPLKGGAICHNGILPPGLHAAAGDEESDTSWFVDRILNEIPNWWSPALLHLIENAIGQNNKLVALVHGVPTAVIVNEEAGVWDEGIWYSNRGFEKPAFHASIYPGTCFYGPYSFNQGRAARRQEVSAEDASGKQTAWLMTGECDDDDIAFGRRTPAIYTRRAETLIGILVTAKDNELNTEGERLLQEFDDGMLDVESLAEALWLEDFEVHEITYQNAPLTLTRLDHLASQFTLSGT